MNIKIVAVIVLFAVAVGAALAFTFTQGGMEYRTFPQVTGSEYGGERVKMKVQVISIESAENPAVFIAEDLAPDANDPKANFNVPRGKGKVIYAAPVPSGFKLGCHATLEGRYDEKKGAFVATNMQTQCPSKYEGQETPALSEKPATGTP
ncbi:MAG: cytochrome c maturation protein CcmE [Planctomycetes bacterium]|jgi:cytochrome c-type biogenesis protein CcmE|nr:cytochrome c maturation protein CcmE [Planctomycetota bacterium]